ncbi:MAG: caspase family protein [Methylococcales bacterium]|nr:caspase family protein [Methylococcales bacterium]
MKNKTYLLSILSLALLLSCARVDSPKSNPAVTAIAIERFDLTSISGTRHNVMVFPWNISKIDLEKYPILRDHRIGFGVTNRLIDVLFDTNRFEFIEEKQEIANRLIKQMKLCQQSKVCDSNNIQQLQLKTADYIIYPEVYHFGIENHTNINGISTANKQYVEVGIQLKIINARTATTESIGSYIGQKVIQTEGDIFNSSAINFSQSSLGKATDHAIKGAIFKLLKRFDRKSTIAATPVYKVPTTYPEVGLSTDASVATESRGKDKSTIIVNKGKTIPLSAIPTISSSRNRVALVIGNAKYQKAGASLDNAENDANDMAGILKKLGFEVLLHTNQTKQGMNNAIKEFGKRLKKAGKDSVALFYYAGHAAEVEGINYLFPVDVKVDAESSAENEAIPAQNIVKQIELAANGLNIILLDACRDNPYPPKSRSFNTKNNRLATMSAPRGTIMAYSTASGKTASDGASRNGLYTGELLKYMRVPNLKIEDLLKNVRISVSKQSNNNQIAWVSSSLEGEFYFIPPKK